MKYESPPYPQLISAPIERALGTDDAREVINAIHQKMNLSIAFNAAVYDFLLLTNPNEEIF